MPTPQLPASHTGPGLVDLQVNGYGGIDFNAPAESLTAEALHEARRRMAARGVVAALITFVTADADAMIARARRYREIVEADADLRAFYPKLHIEGPFISPIEGPRGAHPPAHILRPADRPELPREIQDACGGRIGIFSLAPEVEGNEEVVRWCAGEGICTALAHTAAAPEDIDRAVEAGARMCTHLGNGSHQMLPRLDNYIQYQLAEDRLYASFIADGHHMPLTTLKNMIRAKTPSRTVLVTDAIGAAELPPGIYSLGDEQVEVNETGRAQKPGQDNLAGSTLTLDAAVINTVRACGLPFEQAWEMASTRAARLVGLPAPPEVTVRVDRNRMELLSARGSWQACDTSAASGRK
jgi:N-acetylglucosamine-6-phosphate deacetylase